MLRVSERTAYRLVSGFRVGPLGIRVREDDFARFLEMADPTSWDGAQSAALALEVYARMMARQNNTGAAMDEIVQEAPLGMNGHY